MEYLHERLDGLALPVEVPLIEEESGELGGGEAEEVETIVIKGLYREAL